MTRKAYLLEQRSRGRRLAGVFPTHAPKELLWAFDLLPVEIWDPPLEVRSANAHLQPYICSVAKRGLELLLQGKAELVDIFVFPHLCDSLQNLASLVHDFLKPHQYCLFLYLPKEPFGPSARSFYVRHLQGLSARLEERYGPMDPEALRKAIRQGRRIRRLLRELYQRRSQGTLPLGNESFYALVRQGEYLAPEEFISRLSEVLRQQGETPREAGISVVLSGILPNPVEMLRHLDEMGVRVGQDDLLACGRRLSLEEGPGDEQDQEPFEALADLYFQLPPCPMRASPVSSRTQHLLGLVRESGSRGVIFNGMKFCEPEWFDIPGLQEGLRQAGVPSLVLDTELHQGLSGQVKTRIEAFVEMIR